jgi:putative NIF3 family GTP cyclohydrolase 1 type 2
LEGADPFLGRVGAIETVDEWRLEMILPRRARAAVVAALLARHPYETPAFDVFQLADLPDPVTGLPRSGLGRIGRLAVPCPLGEFAAAVARTLPATAGGVRFAGDPEREVSLVALQAGAGDDLLDVARARRADVYLTSDLRHHPAAEALAWPEAPALADVSHWAAEWTWLPVVERQLTARLEAAGHPVATTVSTLCTDPWTGRAKPG